MCSIHSKSQLYCCALTITSTPLKLNWFNYYCCTFVNVQAHAEVTAAVHEAGSKICMQILHAGRYAYHPWCVAPSPLKSPISPHPPKEMTVADIEATIDDYVRAAELAKEAGYDGVEVR
jgi:2,4-dienoyl-CoA reductase (NADPH2)